MDKSVTPTRGFAVATALVVSLFFAWGVANSLNDILIPQFKKAFVLTDLETGLVQSAFYGGYFVFAMPAALFMRRFGYKAAVVLGLLLYAAGAVLFFPAAEEHKYIFFLGALFVIASGLSFLETSANPLVAVLGAPATSERRLNFAQAFNPLGVLFGVYVGSRFILSNRQLPATQLAHDVVGPYLAIAGAVLLWALLLALVKFPPVATARVEQGSEEPGGFLKLFAHKRFLFGVMAQFFYVAAQVGVWSFTIRYTQHAVPELPITSTEHAIVWSDNFVPTLTGLSAADILLASQTIFMVGRFVGTALMGRVNPERLMAVYAAIGVVLTAVAALVGGWTGVVCLAMVSFFMSIMFPTIFAGALRGLGPLTKSGSSFLVMAIIGGALAPPVMGLISGLSSMQAAMVVPSLCFGVILAFALVSAREKTA
jgi:FHS family L-fucose permease-like MFS transporter